jgi:hypothetical protein
VGWSSQLKAFLRRLTSSLGLPTPLRNAIAGDAPLTPDSLNAFIASLRDKDRVLGQETQHTARALVLYGSQDLAAQDIGYAYLNSVTLSDFGERAAWGMAVESRPPSLVVRDISRLLALTGSPTVIAFDQLDTLFAQSGGSTINAGGALDSGSAATLGQVANGLMALRELTRKALIVVACIPDTWKILRREAVGPVPDRFREARSWAGFQREGRHGDRAKAAGGALRRRRLPPPYPTWPIRELASPRRITSRHGRLEARGAPRAGLSSSRPRAGTGTA